MVTKNFLFSVGKKSPKVMNSEDTIKYILKNNASIGRYGDGELELIYGKSLNFQTYNPELSHRLSKINTNQNFLVCIPDIFNKKSFNKKVLKTKEYVFWGKNKLLYGYLWKKIFACNKIIGDAFISRFYMRYNNANHVTGYIELFRRLWDKRNLLIVEGESSKVGCENDLLKNAKSIRRIICPNKNAYDYYEDIINAVKKNYKEGDLVLLALGPTATVLAYDLSSDGIQSLDLGHFDIEYEWYLAGAINKIPVKNKHVNECDTLGTTHSLDKEYNKQIISIIKEFKNE